jgi:hypothetical protein
VAGVTLHTVQSAAVDGYNGALHVNQIVLAQTASVPSLTIIVPHRRELLKTNS